MHTPLVSSPHHLSSLATPSLTRRDSLQQPFFSSPDFIGSSAPAGVADTDPVDLVFVDFIETQLLGILNTVQTAKTFTTADVASYTPILASEVLGLYAQKAWN